MMIKSAIEPTEEEEFANWLRHTAKQLKLGDLPPESWEQRSPFDDSSVRRRIARLISTIAEKPKHGRD
jgi:hypothetical protein